MDYEKVDRLFLTMIGSKSKDDLIRERDVISREVGLNDKEKHYLIERIDARIAELSKN